MVSHSTCSGPLQWTYSARGYDFPKPDFVNRKLARMAVGKEGLLTVEGEVHRRQRKILNPAFSPSKIKSLTPIFWAKATELRDIWLAMVSSGQVTTPPFDPFSADISSSADKYSNNSRARPLSTSRAAAAPSSIANPISYSASSEVVLRRSDAALPRKQDRGTSLTSCKIDVLAWLARATLDVIGEAGFGYEFNSIATAAYSREDGDLKDELATAFEAIFSSERKFSMLTTLQLWFPVLSRFGRKTAVVQNAHAAIRRIGLSLIERRREVVAKDRAKRGWNLDTDLSPDTQPMNAFEENKVVTERDLLSILIRSNVSANPSQRLSTNEVLCQISTFLVAGHETTASALTWTLYALARAPDVQRILRARLSSIQLPSDSSSPAISALDEVIHHDYLDHVVRESLRLHAPVSSTMRVVAKDGVIPVSRPFTDRRGRVCNVIRVKKGDLITIPIQAMNKSTSVYGEDARDFRPERWTDVELAKDQNINENEQARRRRAMVPGLWGNILTFGNGNPAIGNRACIGYRFALSEIKIFLFILLRDLEFSIDPYLEIEKKQNVVIRPCVKSEPLAGNQMPLYIRRVSLDCAEQN
ncbi:hypothetical protein AcW1_007249 [Taiwanofungus camphoratus]|nr:hypothetical protein AcW1_007249 [Antrodia cinnamomea]